MTLAVGRKDALPQPPPTRGRELRTPSGGRVTPAAYTRGRAAGGGPTAAREPRFQHDPAVPIPPLPALSAANELRSAPKAHCGFCVAQLTRGQNQVVAAMRAALKVVLSAT